MSLTHCTLSTLTHSTRTHTKPNILKHNCTALTHVYLLPHVIYLATFFAMARTRLMTRKASAPLLPPHKHVSSWVYLQTVHRHQIANLRVRVSPPVFIIPLKTSLLGEYIKRGNVLKQAQDASGRQHKVPPGEDLTDFFLSLLLNCYFRPLFALKQRYIIFWLH